MLRVWARWVAFTFWGYLTWVVLTWTATAEQLVFGAVVAAAVGGACVPLGGAARPWRVLPPARLLRIVRTGWYVLVHLVKANVALSIRIWRPSRPLRPGMVIVASRARSEGGVAAVGLLSSLIVDNQIIDVDRARQQMQYHGVAVAPGDADTHRADITGPLEDLLVPLEDR